MSTISQRWVTLNPREQDLMGRWAPSFPGAISTQTATGVVMYQEVLEPTLGDFKDLLSPTGTPGAYLIFAGVSNELKSEPIVFNLETPGIPRSSLLAVSQDFEFVWLNDTTLVIYSSSDPSTNYSSIHLPQDVVKFSAHSDPSKYKPLRRLYHPGRDEVLIYPRLPDRTLNYYHNPTRKFDVTEVKTLSSHVNVMDQQSWEAVTIQEVWGTNVNDLSMLSEFVEALHLFTQEIPPLGRHVGWQPEDLSFSRHLIQPISLEVGGTDIDIREVREDLGTRIGSYIDRQVTFTFRLVRATQLANTLIIAEGY